MVDPYSETSHASSAEPRSRRDFLRLAATAAGAVATGGLAVACSGGASAATQPEQEVVLSTQAWSTPTPTPTAAPRPVPAAGRFARPMMAGTPYETELVLAHSGVRGPVLMVLGGVHGNEPGGFLAAEEVATWMPRTGSLLVIPRANIVADRALERTFSYLGDLNRSYPGNPAGLPMEQMAAQIIGVAQEFGVEVLLDMHESWIFFAERSVNGTAYLGQTIGSSGADGEALARNLVANVNSQLGVQRDHMYTRDQLPLPNSTPSQPQIPNAGQGGRGGSSSLSAGRFVPGLIPLLVEMGQYNQPVSRRVELHMLTARTLMEMRGGL